MWGEDSQGGEYRIGVQQGSFSRDGESFQKQTGNFAFRNSPWECKGFPGRSGSLGRANSAPGDIKWTLPGVHHQELGVTSSFDRSICVENLSEQGYSLAQIDSWKQTR